MRLFALLTFLIISLPANAQNYYYHLPSNPGVQFSSAGAACDSYFSQQYSAWNASGSRNRELQQVSSTDYRCSFDLLDRGSWFPRTTTITRMGASCPPGTTLNPQAGACELPAVPPGEVCGPVSSVYGFPKIANSVGQCVDWPMLDKASACSYLGANTGTQFKNVLVFHLGEGAPAVGAVADSLGCELSVLDTAHCKEPVMTCGSEGGLSICSSSAASYCKVAVTYTGAYSGDGDELGVVPVAGVDSQNEGICTDVTDCSVPEQPDKTDEQPCTYVQDAEGRMVCSFSKWHHKPGETNCGTVNGQFECITKKPTSNGIVIDTTVQTTNNPDGTTTTVKQDTHSKVTCSGVGSCSSTSTITTQTTTKNGNGETIAQTTDCTGPNCAKGGAGGKGDSDGDGVDDCIDPAKCEDVTGPKFAGNDEVPEYGETLENFMDKVQEARFIAAATSITIPGGGSCVLPDANVYFGVIRFQTFCDNIDSFLGPILNLIMAMWGFLALRILLSA